MSTLKNTEMALAGLYKIGRDANPQEIAGVTGLAVMSIYGVKKPLKTQGLVADGEATGYWHLTDEGKKVAKKLELPEQGSNAVAVVKEPRVSKRIDLQVQQAQVQREKMVLANNLLTTFNNIFKD